MGFFRRRRPKRGDSRREVPGHVTGAGAESARFTFESSASRGAWSAPVIQPSRQGRLRERPGVRARQVELTVGTADSAGVTVRKIRLSPGTRKVVIIRSQGVQAGDHNRQLNHFRYTVGPPRISIDDLLRGHPGRQRALARLAAHPDSAPANYAFRRLLTSESAWDRGRVRPIRASHPTIVRTAASLNARGAVVIKRSRGVQAGRWNTQHNHFHYRVEPPKHAFEALLRRNPGLVHALAVMARNPGNQAVRRSFNSHLAGTYRPPGQTIRHLNTRASGAARLAVHHGCGVQIGRDNQTRNEGRTRVSGVPPVGLDDSSLAARAAQRAAAAPRAAAAQPAAARLSRGKPGRPGRSPGRSR